MYTEWKPKNILYIQQIYNISLHNSIGHNTFHVCLGFQSLDPIGISPYITSTHEDSSHAPIKEDKE